MQELEVLAAAARALVADWIAQRRQSLKALVGTAASVVIVAGGVWGFTAWQRHQVNEAAQKECITN